MIIDNNYFNLADIILETQEMFVAKNSIDKRNLEIRTTIPQYDFNLFSDEEKIKQILLNLMDNAYKFTTTGFVEIGFEIESEYVKCYVKDTGEGINYEKKKRLFNQLKSSSDSIASSHVENGLGLIISATLIELLNGEIGFESELKKGSVFWITIPRLTTQKACFEKNSNQHPFFHRITGKKVLIIDQDETSNLMLEKLLQNHEISYSITSHNEITANNFLPCSSHDLLMLNINQQENYNLIDYFKQQNQEIKIMAIAHEPSFQDKQEALIHGADDFIAKPLKEENLLLKMCKLLG